MSTKVITNKENNDKLKAKWGKLPADARLETSGAPFRALGRTLRITNAELARDMRVHFSEVFHDLIGMNISMHGPDFFTEMFFEYNRAQVPEGKIRNLVNLVEPEIETVRRSEGRIDLSDINDRNQQKLSGKTFILNDETKLLLSDFMYGGRGANLPNNINKWNDCTRIIQQPPITFDPYGRNADRIIVGVTGFDLRVLLRYHFGDSMVIDTNTDSDGDDVNHYAKAKYDAQYQKMLPDGTFIIWIEQFDEAAVRQYTVKENPQLQINAGPIMY